MTSTYIKIEDGKIVVTNDVNDIFADWDGVYYNVFGHTKEKHTYNGKVYDCFPIVTLSEDLTQVIAIEMFGCEDGNQCEDGYLDIPIDFNEWNDIKPFNDLIYRNYLLVGMILHPEGNYENDAEGVADYNKIVEDMGVAVELLNTKYRVQSDNVESFKSSSDYYIDEDADGIYLFKRLSNI